MINIMLIFIKKLNHKHKDGSALGLYYCVCGNFKIYPIYQVINNKKKSCGCLSKQKLEKYRCSKITHGMSQNYSEYRVWDGMKQRCYNKNSKSYKDYGERGIKVCDRWINSFENFYNDIGPRPTKKHTIERKDNNGNYNIENCYWATKKEQERNKRSNRRLKYNNQDLTIAEWSERTNLPYNIIKSRIDTYGWSIEETLNTPINRRKK